MPIVVACKCGQTFQTKDEYAGRTGRCPACGQPLLIQPAAVAPVQPHAAEMEAEPVNPRAAAVQLARERQAEADRRFLLRMGLAAAAVIVVVALVVGVRMGLASNSTAAATPAESAQSLPKAASNVATPPAATQATQATQAPSTAAPPAQPKKHDLDLSKFPVKDDIDRYVLLALKTRDRHTRMNAKIFRPDEPLLDFEPDERVLTPEHYKSVEERLNKLASKMDLDLGLQPGGETDLLEARMLLDTELVGSGAWLGTQGGRNNYLVFVDPPTLRMAQFTEKFGKPQKSLKSGDVMLHFVGRIVLMEAADGALVGVARRITRIAKLAEPEPSK